MWTSICNETWTQPIWKYSRQNKIQIIYPSIPCFDSSINFEIGFQFVISSDFLNSILRGTLEYVIGTHSSHWT